MFKNLLLTTTLAGLCSGGVQAAGYYMDSNSGDSGHVRKKVQTPHKTPHRSTFSCDCCKKLKDVNENIGWIEGVREPLTKLIIIERHLKKGGGELVDCVKQNFKLVGGHNSHSKAPLDEQLKKAIHDIDQNAHHLAGTNGAIDNLRTQLGVISLLGGPEVSLSSGISTQLQAQLYYNLNGLFTLIYPTLISELSEASINSGVLGPVLGTLVTALNNVTSDITSLPVTLTQEDANNLGILLNNVNILLSDKNFNTLVVKLLGFANDPRGITGDTATSPLVKLVSALGFFQSGRGGIP